MSVPNHMLDEPCEPDCPRCAGYEAAGIARQAAIDAMTDRGVNKGAAAICASFHGSFFDAVYDEVEAAVKGEGGKLCVLCNEDPSAA